MRARFCRAQRPSGRNSPVSDVSRKSLISLCMSRAFGGVVRRPQAIDLKRNTGCVSRAFYRRGRPCGGRLPSKSIYGDQPMNQREPRAVSETDPRGADETAYWRGVDARFHHHSGPVDRRRHRVVRSAMAALSLQDGEARQRLRASPKGWHVGDRRSALLRPPISGQPCPSCVRSQSPQEVAAQVGSARRRYGVASLLTSL
jgi:hypothetical protein